MIDTVLHAVTLAGCIYFVSMLALDWLPWYIEKQAQSSVVHVSDEEFKNYGKQDWDTLLAEPGRIVVSSEVRARDNTPNSAAKRSKKKS